MTRPNPNIGSFLTRVPEMFLPVFWFEAEAEVTEELADQVRLVGQLPGLARTAGILSLLAGLIILAVIAVVRVVSRVRQNKQEHLTGNIPGGQQEITDNIELQKQQQQQQ